MHITDPVADMLTRIRNANSAKHDTVDVPASNMSRIGRMPITVPADVSVNVAKGNVVTVKGPKGMLTRALRPEMIIKQDGNTITVDRPSEDKLHKSLHDYSQIHRGDQLDAPSRKTYRGCPCSGRGIGKARRNNPGDQRRSGAIYP